MAKLCHLYDLIYRGDRDVMDIRLGGQVLIHQPMTKVIERVKGMKTETESEIG